ncbi:unnamed protein product [Oppiella nova]|uniref:Uncharacterized protein n=1 Tax=Oppiella nova TaxID=334625 RepID=A0A7R9L9F7_9ACAR|nr:unnamed protein product [Oppiella nova]CAG2157585.1 unnamed protein product [Oppiella nova]
MGCTDNIRAWELDANDQWHAVQPKDDEKPYIAQQVLMQQRIIPTTAICNRINHANRYFHCMNCIDPMLRGQNKLLILRFKSLIRHNIGMMITHSLRCDT